MSRQDPPLPDVDVVGVGANSIDQVVRIASGIETLAATGKSRAKAPRLSSGGQTATAMCACAALGLRVRYIGVFGGDEHGRRVRADIAARGVDVSGSVDADAPNAGAVIVVDGAGRRLVLWRRDERLRLPPEDIDADALRGSRAVHVDDVDVPAALHAASLARALGIPVTSDIEQAGGEAERLVRAVTHPIFDHNAPEALTGERDPERALRKIRRWNPGLLCMTLAEQGAAALDGDVFHLAPAAPVRVVDATGAGDVFRAGFLFGLLRGWAAPQLLRFANAAAAASCTRVGAIASVPPLSAVDELLQLSS